MKCKTKPLLIAASLSTVVYAGSICGTDSRSEKGAVPGLTLILIDS